MVSCLYCNNHEKDVRYQYMMQGLLITHFCKKIGWFRHGDFAKHVEYVERFGCKNFDDAGEIVNIQVDDTVKEQFKYRVETPSPIQQGEAT